VTLAAADLRLFDVGECLGAHRRDVDVLAESEESRGNPGFKYEMRTSVGHDNSGDRTGCAQLGLPCPAVGGAVNQAAFLLISPPKEVLVIEGAFAAGRSSHCGPVKPG